MRGFEGEIVRQFEDADAAPRVQAKQVVISSKNDVGRTAPCQFEDHIVFQVDTISHAVNDFDNFEDRGEPLQMKFNLGLRQRPQKFRASQDFAQFCKGCVRPEDAMMTDRLGHSFGRNGFGPEDGTDENIWYPGGPWWV